MNGSVSEVMWRHRDGSQEPATVVLGDRSYVARWLGVSVTALPDTLRALRDDGVLICAPGSLRSSVRVDDPAAPWGYRLQRGWVFRGRWRGRSQPLRPPRPAKTAGKGRGRIITA